jgi:uncharacterized protein
MPDPSDLRRKSLNLDVKALTDSGSFSVYAAVFGNVDRQGEIVQPGAFSNLDAFVQDGWGDINHEWEDLGIATIDAAEQDSIGLKVTGQFHSTEDAQRIRTKIQERMARGKSVKCSIGYRVVDGATEVRDGKPIFIIKSAELFEFSFVNLPANPMAGVTAVKSWADEIETAYTALSAARKGGRVLSGKNRDRLCKCRDMLSEAHKELHALLQETEPQGSEPGEGGDPESGGSDAPKTAGLTALRKRLLDGRLRIGLNVVA